MADEQGTGDRALRRRYDQMRELRLDSMRNLARRDTALALLEENGTVTAEDVDRRLEATFTPPDPATLANLLAQKAAAAVEHTMTQLEAEREGVQRLHGKRETLQGFLDANDTEVADAEQRVADLEGVLEEARAMARFAGVRGDADLAPAGSNVNVEPATADSNAQGG